MITFSFPVIVSSIGGLPEVMGDAGVVMEGMGVDELRSKINALHQDEQLRIRIGEKGKERNRIFPVTGGLFVMNWHTSGGEI